MKRFTSISLGMLIAFCLLVGTDRRAWGYVDPGSGLIALQTAASVVAAYLYYIRRRILSLFRRKDKESDPAGVLPMGKTGNSREAA